MALLKKAILSSLADEQSIFRLGISSKKAKLSDNKALEILFKYNFSSLLECEGAAKFLKDMLSEYELMLNKIPSSRTNLKFLPKGRGGSLSKECKKVIKSLRKKYPQLVVTAKVKLPVKQELKDRVNQRFRAGERISRGEAYLSEFCKPVIQGHSGITLFNNHRQQEQVRNNQVVLSLAMQAAKTTNASFSIKEGKNQFFQTGDSKVNQQVRQEAILEQNQNCKFDEKEYKLYVPS